MKDFSDPESLDYLPTMPRNRDVGIGCVGAGFIMSDCHLVAYCAAGLRPLGITSRRQEAAAEVARRHGLETVFDSVDQMLADDRIEVIDVAVPPDALLPVVRRIVQGKHVRGILAQKPLGGDLAQATQIVRLCREAGITLCVNQNMRYDQSVRACKHLLDGGVLGDPVLATIDMRAIPHWMPWQQRQGWLTCRIMSIHHLDTMRYWLGEPRRVFASFRTDPRTAFEHVDGIGLYVLEYDSGVRCLICDDVWTGPAREGAAADLGIHWRVEGTQGLAKGEIGWPKYPERQPSTIDYTSTRTGRWHRPRWDQVWFPDAFLGPMAELLVALENGEQPTLSGQDNLKTMALVDACYRSASDGRAVELEKGS
ncbi:Gfo/Idh/MocA family oxidoreductase [Roseiconus nitratireducens]|uniref:Gfo/Idh/MocA family oxidoreductase n=1 Tax=Roseiconus nitratireducens TaxID=2605748 RepID=A0A5M6DA12_9BACT|nr:Gfo/Idh/MocA family oxidoreductase [Roseiconus nitratireducens]KAA5542799.1 Gfo/Idh/MocA family oxidoreductase [Roseiconus nitratireducens]